MKRSLQRSMLLVVAIMLIVPLVAAGQAKAEVHLAFTPRGEGDIGKVRLQGSGATFPEPAYQRLITNYASVAPHVSINYQGVGSGTGKNNFLDGLTDFGGTDSVIDDAKFATSDALHVPMLMGPVVATYNLDVGKKALRFSGTTLAKIFAGDITKWNHADIQADNPGRTLPDTNITVVYRSDGSGTSSVFSSYLAAIDSRFQATQNFVPLGGTKVGKEKNSGVADEIARTPGAIGYVEYTYAKTNRLPTPKIQNRYGAKKWIRPSLASTSLALDPTKWQQHPDLRFSIVDSPDEDAYPIAAITWILVHQNKYTDLNKAKAVTDFIRWALDTNQKKTEVRLGYAPLSDAATVESIRQLCKVEVSGTKAFTEGCP